MKLATLKKKLKEIQELGFVKTHRKGDTGVGKTLEDLLGIKENNISLPDIGKIAELKASRKSTGSMMTLFTFEPKPRGGERCKTLLNSFGYLKKEKDHKELRNTLSCKRYNNQNLKLKIEKDKLCVIGKNKKLNIYWDTEEVKKKFEEKFPALVHVLAHTKDIEATEYFHFDEAYFLEGFSFEKFKEMLKRDEICVEFRMKYTSGEKVRNHGTAFRIRNAKLHNAFETKKRLL